MLKKLFNTRFPFAQSHSCTEIAMWPVGWLSQLSTYSKERIQWEREKWNQNCILDYDNYMGEVYKVNIHISISLVV